MINTWECGWRSTLGLYCPGCGGTRALNSLLQGDLYQAFRFNPYLFTVLPLLVILFLHSLYKRNTAYTCIVMHSALLTLIIYGILRNLIPWLQPTLVR